MRMAVIPARGGSKRIPRKNIKQFAGKPMIAWSIEAALQSECFDKVIVSTDDEEIASVALRQGAEVPFIRPATLSDDHTGTIPVIAHAIEWQNMNGTTASTVCCIYATAPFIQSSDLRRALLALESSDAAYAFSVATYAYPIQRAIRINAKGRVEMLNPELFNTRSQDLEETWHDAGQFYFGKAQAWLTGKKILSSEAIPIVLPRFRVQDIDSPEDWEHAERLFNSIKQ